MVTKNIRTLKNSPILLTSIASFFCLSAIAYLQFDKFKNLTQSQFNQADYQKQEQIESVKLNTVGKSPSFGFGNVIADWTMLQFIQYYGDNVARKQTGYSLSPKYLKTLVKNDPRFISAYLIISPASSISAGRPDQTVSSMEEGLKQLSPDIPNAYFVWLYKGIDELLFLGDIEAAKKSYEMASQWAKIAKNPFIERSARETVQYLSKNPDSKQAQVGAWLMVFVGSPDQKTRQLAKQEIENLGGTLTVTPDGRVMAIPPKKD